MWVIRPPFCVIWAWKGRGYIGLRCSHDPIGMQLSTGEVAEKGFELFEAKPSLQSPGSIEEYPCGA